MIFSTRLNNHINHAKLLSGWLFRMRVIENVAWYTNVLVFMFALTPILRAVFATPNLTAAQIMAGLVVWFAVMITTACSWTSWKSKKMRHHGFKTITPDKNLTRPIFVAAEPYATSDQNEDILKIFEKNNMPWVWWEELQVLVDQEKEKEKEQGVKIDTHNHPPFTRVGNVLHL